MADQVAVWGSPQQIAEQIVRLRDAGVNYILLNHVFDEEAQMEPLCQDFLPLVQ
jgi:alkanesulfonate monooxygenase SsuD/methylene tetrahydromethanopterin reductase-like flavin-dependent oxidoreductase (luciferase family)